MSTHKAAAFLYDDDVGLPSYVVDGEDRVWFIHDLIDEDGEETGEVDNAVIVTVFHPELGWGHVNLLVADHPEVH